MAGNIFTNVVTGGFKRAFFGAKNDAADTIKGVIRPAINGVRDAVTGADGAAAGTPAATPAAGAATGFIDLALGVPERLGAALIGKERVNALKARLGQGGGEWSLQDGARAVGGAFRNGLAAAGVVGAVAVTSVSGAAAQVDNKIDPADGPFKIDEPKGDKPVTVSPEPFSARESALPVGSSAGKYTEAGADGQVVVVDTSHLSTTATPASAPPAQSSTAAAFNGATKPPKTVIFLLPDDITSDMASSEPSGNNKLDISGNSRWIGALNTLSKGGKLSPYEEKALNDLAKFVGAKDRTELEAMIKKPEPVRQAAGPATNVAMAFPDP